MSALCKTLGGLAVAVVLAVPGRVLGDVPLTGAGTTFGPAPLTVVTAGVGLGTQPATLSVTVPAGGSVLAAYLYVTGRGAGDGSVQLNGMTTALPLLATSGPLPFDATQSVETRRLAVTLGAGTTTFTIAGYTQHTPGGAFVVAVVNDPAAPLGTVTLLEGSDYAFHGFPPPFGPDTEVGAFTFAASGTDRAGRLLLFTHDTLADRGDATWVLAADSAVVPRPARLVGGGGGAVRVEHDLLGVPASSGGLSRGPELDVDDRTITVPPGADYVAFQVESAADLTAPESLALVVAVLALPVGDGAGSSTTTTTTPGASSSSTSLPGGGSTSTTTPDGGGSTTTLPGGGSTTTTTPGGGSTSTTLPGGGGSTTTTTPGGASTSTSVPGGGGSTSTTTRSGGSTSTTLPGGGGSTSTTLTSASTSTSLASGGNPPPPTCGNGVLDLDEECDDGNRASGDGCDASCMSEDTGETWSINLRVRAKSIERLNYLTLLPNLPPALLGTVPVHITLSSREFQMLDAEIPASAFRVKPQPVLAQPDGRSAVASGKFGNWHIKLTLTPVEGLRAYDARLRVRGEMLPSTFAKLSLRTVLRIGGLVYTTTDPIRNNHTGKFMRYIHPVLDE